MRLATRIQKLERTKFFRRHLSPLEQYERALQDAAFRLIGSDWSVAQEDRVAAERVMDDLGESFFPNLGSADLTNLVEELGRLTFGDDIAALEAMKRDVRAELDREQFCEQAP